jgi:hypothetical protein
MDSAGGERSPGERRSQLLNARSCDQAREQVFSPGISWIG